MRSEFRELRLRQLQRALVPFQAAASVSRPPKGWIRSIREALGVSSAELAERLGTKRQLVIQQEKAEREDRITLRSLRELARALDCELVYSVVPRRDLNELANAGARAKARANVLGVEHSMALENQAPGGLDEAVEAETQRLTRKRGR